jgi:hypothetical protein
MVDDVELREENSLKEDLKAPMEMVSSNHWVVAYIISNQAETLLLITRLPPRMVLWKVTLQRVPVVVGRSERQEGMRTQKLTAQCFKGPHPAIPVWSRSTKLSSIASDWLKHLLQLFCIIVECSAEILDCEILVLRVHLLDKEASLSVNLHAHDSVEDDVTEAGMLSEAGALVKQEMTNVLLVVNISKARQHKLCLATWKEWWESPTKQRVRLVEHGQRSILGSGQAHGW